EIATKFRQKSPEFLAMTFAVSALSYIIARPLPTIIATSPFRHCEARSNLSSIIATPPILSLRGTKQSITRCEKTTHRPSKVLRRMKQSNLGKTKRDCHEIPAKIPGISRNDVQRFRQKSPKFPAMTFVSFGKNPAKSLAMTFLEIGRNDLCHQTIK
ncbi:MAG TPA: hypothetical protein VIQ23_12845, partial [Hanamia sp.]